jgi:hypothetical protein
VGPGCPAKAGETVEKREEWATALIRERRLFCSVAGWPFDAVAEEIRVVTHATMPLKICRGTVTLGSR